MSILKVDTIQKADGTGSLSVPAESGTVVTTASPSLGRRNIIINGAMQVNQRGTSSVTTSNAFIYDRFKCMKSGALGLTTSASTDAPDGFTNSIKFEVTSASTRATSGVYYQVEAQDVQHLAYGTSSAKEITASVRL